jgi:hypothetical protein
MIGKLQRVPLREVWKNEALEFTPWLQENIDVLNDVLDLSLTNVEREQSAGDFSVDLVGGDGVGYPVIIENQLDKSDHDHLGKLITYLTAFNAKLAIWIVAYPRPEHVAAISWLNESSAASFYLLKVEAVKIGESLPAPLLTLIVGPSKEGRRFGEINQRLAEQEELRRRFWEALIERAKDRTKLHTNLTPDSSNWMGTGAGKAGITYQYNIRQHDTMVLLYIDQGKDSYDQNKEVFDTFYASKDSIEADFGDTLEWERLDDRKSCRIMKTIDLGGYRDEDKWPEVHDAMIDAMIRLEKALRPHIARLQA